MEEQNKEFRIKLDRVKKLLEQEHLYGIFMKRQDNFAWMTCGKINYVAAGEMGNCGLLVTREKLFAITNNIEADRMREEEKLEDMGFEMNAGVWYDTEFEEKTIRSICKGRPVGYDFGAGDDNIAGKLQQLRFSLTEQEVQRYLDGGIIVSRLIEETAAALRPGETEWSVTARAAMRAREEGLEVISLFCGSDERISRYRHAIATEKKIRNRVQMGGNLRYQGLVICLTRYVNFVPVSRELRAQYRDNVLIDCTMIGESRIGESYQKPFMAGKNMYEQLGYGQEFSMHHQGGPIGYAPRDYRIDFSHTDLIAKNQAFCWNPSITGTKSEDTVISTEQGPLFVTRPCFYPKLELNTGGHPYIRPDILEKY